MVGVYDMSDDLTGVGCAKASISILQDICCATDAIPFSDPCLY